VAFTFLKGAVMLNIRINWEIDLKKVAVMVTALYLTLGPVAAAPARAVEPVLVKLAPFKTFHEKVVNVSLQYLNVSTTKSDALKALSSPYAKYYDPQTLAFLMTYAKGMPAASWKCLNSLWNNESHFNPKALNKGSNAFGIAQFLPTTWGNYNLQKTTNTYDQIKDGLRYIQSRYGSTCHAWSFWQKHYWY
jgi:hypothetical protein